MQQITRNVFNKIGTPLYFCNNILPCGPISKIDIPNCSAKNWLGMCDTFTYLTFKYSLKSPVAEEWDKLDQHIIDKAVKSGERDFERVWLQVEDSLTQDVNIYYF